MPGSIDSAVYAFFARASRARGRRFLHPGGASYRGVLAAEDGPPGERVFAPGFTRPAVVRFSRALGFPSPLPDFLGLALRLPDAYGEGAHQDLLFASSGTAAVLKVIPRPAAGFFGPSFSSLLPYRVDGRLVLLGSFAETPSEASSIDPLAALVETAARAPLRFALAVARPWGEWSRVAVVSLDERLDDRESAELRFNPWNTGGGLEPAGWPNRIRDPAYRGSQAGRARSG